MTSFQISITPSRRAAGRYILHVRRAIQRALVESGLSQSDISRSIGVHRSVISKEIRGRKDITLGRVAELAWAMGKEPVFTLVSPAAERGANRDVPQIQIRSTSSPAGGSAAFKTVDTSQKISIATQ